MFHPSYSSEAVLRLDQISRLLQNLTFTSPCSLNRSTTFLQNWQKNTLWNWHILVSMPKCSPWLSPW